VKKEVERTILVDMYVCDACGKEMADEDTPSDTIDIVVDEFRGLTGILTVVHTVTPKDSNEQADVCRKCLLDTVAYVGRNLGENGDRTP
jgi:protein-arginine kinase activator protein McsA